MVLSFDFLRRVNHCETQTCCWFRSALLVQVIFDGWFFSFCDVLFAISVSLRSLLYQVEIVFAGPCVVRVVWGLIGVR